MNEQSPPTLKSDVLTVRRVDLAELTKKHKRKQIQKIANWYNTDDSSCSRIRSVGNGL